jgi:hypothetical protein
MDLADAALTRVAEREDLTRIFTLDRRHFSVYRPGRRRRFSILPDKPRNRRADSRRFLLQFAPVSMRRDSASSISALRPKRRSPFPNRLALT